MKDWQTLIAGLLAIVAALIGGYFINFQVKATQRIQSDKDRSRLAAACSVFPLTLTYIVEYALRCGAHVKLIVDTADDRGLIPRNIHCPDVPELPIQIIDGLKEMIEAAPAKYRGAISFLIKDMQIHNSRLRDTNARLKAGSVMVTKNNLEYAALAYAFIYAHASALFPYARGETDLIADQITLDDLTNALRRMEFDRDDYPEMFTTAGRRIDAQNLSKKKRARYGLSS